MVFQHYFELLRSQRWQILFMIGVTTVAFALSSYHRMRTSPEYSAAANVVMMPTEAELTFSQDTAGGTVARAMLTETYIEYVKSRPVVESALGRVKEVALASGTPVEEPIVIPSTNPLIEMLKSFADRVDRFLKEIDTGAYVEVPETEREIAAMQKAIDVSNVTNTHILRIAVTLPDPQAAALMANTLAESYVERISEQLNSDANELESYLQTEIARKEAELAALRAEQTRLTERFGLLQDTTGNGILDQMRVVETQLAELHSRLLSVNLSRASTSTQVRMIEPAIVPVVPSTPGVIRMTTLGLFVGVLLAFATVIIRDTLSDTIRTTADLRRVVGVRSIGQLQRGWVTRRKMRHLRQLGLQFERHFTALGSEMRKALPKRLRTAIAPPAMEGEIVAQEEVLAANSDHAVVTAISKLKKEERTSIEPPPSAQDVLVTGFLSMDRLCWATIGISAAFATMGKQVYCKLPEGKIKKAPKMKFKSGGKLVYDDPVRTDELDDYITVQCVEPMDSDSAFRGRNNTKSPIICVVPRDEIEEEVIETMKNRFATDDSRDLSFILMSA